MNRFSLKFLSFLWLLFLVWLPISIQAIGGLKLNGQLGVDYEFHDYDTESERLIRASLLQRSISNHYLHMNLSGPIVNDNFATFVTRSKIYGTYFRTENTDSLSSTYIDPNLHGFFGQVTFFPSRRYPLQLFYSTNTEHVLKYEAKNRSTEGSQRPEMAVVRRYDSKSNLMGGKLKVDATDRITVDADISSRKSSALRNFEFDEHEDLYIVFEPTRLITLPDSSHSNFDIDTSWTIKIDLINNDTLSGVFVYLEMDPIFYQFPGNPADAIKSVYVPKTSTELTQITLDLTYQIGQYNDFDSDNRNNWEEFIEDFTHTLHAVLLVPDSVRNHNSTLTTIPGDMQWLILPTDPASPPDQDSEGNEFATSVTYDTKENFRNATTLAASDRVDNFQNLTGDEISVSNDLTWDINPRTSVSMRSNQLNGSTVLGNGRKQNTSSFSNLTDASYTIFGGLATSLTHAVNSMSSVDLSSESSNLMNSFRGTVGSPTGYKDHVIEGSATITLTNTEQISPFDTTLVDTSLFDTISRDTSYWKSNESSSKTIALQMANNMSLYKYGMALTPDHILKYQITSQSGTPSKRKLESTSNIKSLILDHKFLGDVIIGIQHSYNRNMDDAGFNATNKTSTLFSMSRYLSEDLTLKAGFGYVIQSFSGESQADDSTGTIMKVDKPSESQTSMSFGGKTSIMDRAFISADYRLSSQATSNTGILGISIRLILPLSVTLISDIKKEVREIEGLPTQTKFFFDNALSFNLRRIVLFFEYNYAQEERFNEIFTYNLWTGKITRSF